jgi:hypothetical protein
MHCLLQGCKRLLRRCPLHMHTTSRKQLLLLLQGSHATALWQCCSASACIAKATLHGGMPVVARMLCA